MSVAHQPIDPSGVGHITRAAANCDGLQFTNRAGTEVLPFRFASHPDDVRLRAQFTEETSVSQFSFKVGAVANSAHHV